jgi:hypothetical protein
MVHVAIEDPSVLKRGVVMLIYPQEARLDQFDHSLWNLIATSCKSILPIQWRSTHIVHPNRFFSIIHPVFMCTLPKEVQDRVIVHSGTKMKVLANLLRYCLPWDRIPSDIGGCVDFDFENWLSERMVKEDKSAMAVPKSGGGLPPLLQGSGAARAALFANVANSLGDQVLGIVSKLMMSSQEGNVPDQATSAFAQGNPFNRSPDNSSDAKPSAKGDDSNSGAVKGPKMMVKSGRKSDPRMDRAVQAKLDDPSLSLVDALRSGGFVFPLLNDAATPQYSVVDSDNVKITQRKNQLLRRLRTVKKKDGSA